MQITHWYADPVTYAIIPLFGIRELQKTTSHKTVHALAGKRYFNRLIWDTGEMAEQDLQEILIFKKYICETEEMARAKRDELLKQIQPKEI